jgi:predicted lysophospholipase L1 biosynthesis ABC-type transport system permease subunit
MAACLGFAAGFLVLAGLILLIHQLAAGTRARRRARRRNADLKALGITAALAVLPALLKGKGGKGLILGPMIALAAYAIYRENVKPDPDDDQGGEAS